MSDRLGVLADIHGNALALEAVLSDARQQGISCFINLGDIFYGPLRPAETYRLLKENIRDFRMTILGNQDRLLLEATAKDLEGNPTLAYVMKDLGLEALEWLRTLEGVEPRSVHVTRSIHVHMDELQLFLCHGSPRSDTEYLLEDVSSGRAVLRSEAEIMELVRYVLDPIILCGHSHVPRVVQLRNGQLIVNPGSVGLPAYEDDLPVKHRMETYSPHASYAILELGPMGWDISLRRVCYDWEEAAQQARELKREDWARGIASGWMR